MKVNLCHPDNRSTVRVSSVSTKGVSGSWLVDVYYDLLSKVFCSIMEDEGHPLHVDSMDSYIEYSDRVRRYSLFYLTVDTTVQPAICKEDITI